MLFLKKDRYKKILLSCFFIMAFFILVDNLRSDFRWHLYSKYVDNSAHTITSAQVWYEESPIAVKFASILNFNSIQYKNHNKDVHDRHIGNLTYPVKIGEYTREVYISYPTGYIMPLYILSIIKGEPPTDKDLYNLNRFLSFVMIVTFFSPFHN